MYEEKKFVWNDKEIKRMLEIKEAINLDRIEMKGNSIIGFRKIETVMEKIENG